MLTVRSREVAGYTWAAKQEKLAQSLGWGCCRWNISGGQWRRGRGHAAWANDPEQAGGGHPVRMGWSDLGICGDSRPLGGSRNSEQRQPDHRGWLSVTLGFWEWDAACLRKVGNPGWGLCGSSRERLAGLCDSFPYEGP